MSGFKFDKVYFEEPIELTPLCLNCLGCTRLEDPNFKGVYKCEWNKPGKENKNVSSNFNH